MVIKLYVDNLMISQTGNVWNNKNLQLVQVESFLNANDRILISYTDRNDNNYANVTVNVVANGVNHKYI